MELLTREIKDNVMHGVVLDSSRKWLWVPENMFALSIPPPVNKGWGLLKMSAGKMRWKGEREYSLNTISFLSEWKSSCSLHCSQVLKEMQMLAFSVRHSPTASPHHPPSMSTSSLPLLYSHRFSQAIQALLHWWIIANKVNSSNRPCFVYNQKVFVFLHTQYKAVVIVVEFSSPLVANFSVGQGSLGGNWQGLSWDGVKKREERWCKNSETHEWLGFLDVRALVGQMQLFTVMSRVLKGNYSPFQPVWAQSNIINLFKTAHFIILITCRHVFWFLLDVPPSHSLRWLLELKPENRRRDQKLQQRKNAFQTLIFYKIRVITSFSSFWSYIFSTTTLLLSN